MKKIEKPDIDWLKIEKETNIVLFSKPSFNSSKSCMYVDIMVEYNDNGRRDICDKVNHLTMEYMDNIFYSLFSLVYDITTSTFTYNRIETHTWEEVVPFEGIEKFSKVENGYDLNEFFCVEDENFYQGYFDELFLRILQGIFKKYHTSTDPWPKYDTVKPFVFPVGVSV